MTVLEGRLIGVQTVKNMITTENFRFVRSRSDRAEITDAWIMRAIAEPLRTVAQIDGRIRKWSYISEVGPSLRVILLEDGVTVHNAFFDRGFKEDEK
jgi:hypothetical protein